MQVLVNSGKHVTSSMDFKDDIRGRIRDKLQRYEDHLTGSKFISPTRTRSRVAHRTSAARSRHE